MAYTLFHRLRKSLSCSSCTMSKYDHMSTEKLLQIRKKASGWNTPIILGIVGGLVLIGLLLKENLGEEYFLILLTNTSCIAIFIEENRKKVKRIDQILKSRNEG